MEDLEDTQDFDKESLSDVFSLHYGENCSNVKINESVVEVGRCGRNLIHGQNVRHFRMSCVRLVCCLRKST